jgi:hypothetical protein
MKRGFRVILGMVLLLSSDIYAVPNLGIKSGGQSGDQMAPGRVQPYTVSANFANVTNFRSFNRVITLSPDQRRMLQRNLFVCTPTDYKQLFHIYENNDYLNLPSFVTTDLVLHLYHVFYGFTLRAVETEFLTPALTRLTQGMLADSIETWQQAQEASVKQAALKNVAYFGVAARSLGLSPNLPPAAAPLVQREMQLIQARQGFAIGAIFPYKIDYSQFIVRGHYTRTPVLSRYFLTMMWYGQAPFALYSGGLRNDEPIRQGILLARSLYRRKLEGEWDRIYGPTAFYVGASDDQTPAQWKAISDRVYGKDAPLSAFADDSRLEEFVAGVKQAGPARIRAKMTLSKDMPDPDYQMRMMGMRYIPDSEVLQRLSEPLLRPFPSGLDVMAALGSRRAVAILDANPRIYNQNNWSAYRTERAKILNEFGQVTPQQWTSNLYWSWLHTLQPLLMPVPEGYPSFMRTQAWADKSLHTALASWAELRHDTILYGKQSAVECGDDDDVPFVKGYVEPNVLFYTRLLNLTKQSREGLTRRRLLSDKLKDRFEQFEDLIAFLKRVSEKQLRNEKLTREEHMEIRYIGGKVEYMTLSVMEGEPSSWGEITSETDKNMAVVADVHTAGDKALFQGVGHATEILVIVPIEGRLTLTRGAAFSYYEFKHPAADRLTDEKWQAILRARRAPDAPVWTRSFLSPTRSRSPKKELLETYSSGC